MAAIADDTVVVRARRTEGHDATVARDTHDPDGEQWTVDDAADQIRGRRRTAQHPDAMPRDRAKRGGRPPGEAEDEPATDDRSTHAVGGQDGLAVVLAHVRAVPVRLLG